MVPHIRNEAYGYVPRVPEGTAYPTLWELVEAWAHPEAFADYPESSISCEYAREQLALRVEEEVHRLVREGGAG